MACQREALYEPALELSAESRPLDRSSLSIRLQNAAPWHELADLTGRSLVYLGVILSLLLLAHSLAAAG